MVTHPVKNFSHWLRAIESRQILDAGSGSELGGAAASCSRSFAGRGRGTVLGPLPRVAEDRIGRERPDERVPEGRDAGKLTGRVPVMVTLMKCGHMSTSVLESGDPCCRQCLGVDPGALESAGPPESAPGEGVSAR